MMPSFTSGDWEHREIIFAGDRYGWLDINRCPMTIGEGRSDLNPGRRAPGGRVFDRERTSAFSNSNSSSRERCSPDTNSDQANDGNRHKAT
jgi:hypothetical protein